MDSEYSRMREGLQTSGNVSNSDGSSSSNKRPPWRIAGRTSNAVSQDTFWTAELVISSGKYSASDTSLFSFYFGRL